jgi:predicted enzyme related to lactoylglutathione lyase
MNHRILVRSLLIDVPSRDHDRALEFWSAALLSTPRRGTSHPEYHVFEDPAARDRILLQDVGDDHQARFHIDIETDDVDAEVARLKKAGAEEVERHKFRNPWPHGRRFHKEPIDHFVIMRDPAGLVFCVVPAESDDFPERAKQVG